MHRNTRATGLLRASALPSVRSFARGRYKNRLDTVFSAAEYPRPSIFLVWYFIIMCPANSGPTAAVCRMHEYKNIITLNIINTIYTFVVILIIDLIICLNGCRANHLWFKTEVVGTVSSRWLSHRCAVCGPASCECYILILVIIWLCDWERLFFKLFKLIKFLTTVFYETYCVFKSIF